MLLLAHQLADSATVDTDCGIEPMFMLRLVAGVTGVGPKVPATVAGPACRGRSLLSKEAVPRLTVAVVVTVRVVLAACHTQHINSLELPVSARVHA